MIKVEIQISRDTFTDLSRRIRSELANIPKEALPVFVANTPIRTGNARNRTSLQGNTILANYAYAGRLDQGYSRQSPQGMVKPTVDFIQQRVKKITGV